MTFCEKASDVLVRLSIQQFCVLAIETEVFLRTASVALKYVHRAMDEIFDKWLIGRHRTQHKTLIFHQWKQQALNLQTTTHTLSTYRPHTHSLNLQTTHTLSTYRPHTHSQPTDHTHNIYYTESNKVATAVTRASSMAWHSPIKFFTWFEEKGNTGQRHAYHKSHG